MSSFKKKTRGNKAKKVTMMPPLVEGEPLRRKSLSRSRRSITFHDLTDFDEVENPTEVTPLLLRSGFDEILGVPTDKFNAVAFSFFYLGMCSMLPWNILISITSFWNYKFRDTNQTLPLPYFITNVTSSFQDSNSSFPGSIAGFHFGVSPPVIKPTEMQLSFPSYVSIASNIPGAITTLLHSGYGQRVRYLHLHVVDGISILFILMWLQFSF